MNNKEMVIRRLTNNDIKSLKNLLENNFDIEVNEYTLEQVISSPSTLSIVALEENKVISHALIQKYFDPVKGVMNAYLEYVCTDKDYRNRGLASILLQTLEEEAKTQNIQNLLLTTSYYRESAQKLYEKLGFKKKESYIYTKEI